jgi:hypothetical protein
MATLSGKSTSGASAFDKYIKNNSKWKDLVLKVEDKMNATFFKPNKTDTHGVLNAGSEMKLASNTQDTIGKLAVAHVKVGSKTGYVALNRIRKPTKTNVMEAEEAAIRDLDKLIKDLVTQLGPIKICTPTGDFPDCVGVRNITEKVLGREAKADFAIVNAKGKDVIFISHKKAGGPAAYQQYGGISPKSGSSSNPTLIYDDKEVQNFMRKVAGFIIDDKLTNPVYSYVKSKDLINKSVYGPSYGGKFGIDNVNMIAQGNPILKPKRNEEACFELNFSDHVSWNGDTDFFSRGDYRAAFAATYRAGRGFDVDGQRYNGARVAIYPVALVKNRSGAQEI